jgi:hypothetical protein
MKCANCSAPITTGLYDDHADAHFCDERCFREWADGKGREVVLAFYRRMNISEVNY